jgi:hypothetical protein
MFVGTSLAGALCRRSGCPPPRAGHGIGVVPTAQKPPERATGWVGPSFALTWERANSPAP